MNNDVYHGTSLKRYEAIITDGLLCRTNKKTTHYPDTDYSRTECDYLYLTDSPIAALEFGLRCWKNESGGTEESPRIVVIKLCAVDGIEVDEKETQTPSVTIGDKANYYRISRDLRYSDACVEIAFFKFDNEKRCYKYIDLLVAAMDYKGDHIKWSKPGDKLSVNCYNKTIVTMLTSDNIETEYANSREAQP